jgi:hypothetical protein
MISWLEENKWLTWTITFLALGMIFYISSQTFESGGGGFGKVTLRPVLYHLLAFFILAIFFFISSVNRKWDFKKINLVLILVAVYAILDELHQFFVPGRVASVNDFFVDFGGIIFASLLYFVIIAKKEKSSSKI